MRTAIEERETQERQDDDATVDEYIRRTTQIESIEELESMREPLDEQIHKYLQRNDYRGANVARRELLAVQTQAIAVQTQAIALERKKSARQSSLRLGGALFCDCRNRLRTDRSDFSKCASDSASRSGFGSPLG